MNIMTWEILVIIPDGYANGNTRKVPIMCSLESWHKEEKS